ncbi:MAG: type II secretion system protein GspD [Methylococcaceae bacterium]|nr:type II secretion system protein GspD [Methylococcaceae bacterium]
MTMPQQPSTRLLYLSLSVGIMLAACTAQPTAVKLPEPMRTPRVKTTPAEDRAAAAAPTAPAQAATGIPKRPQFTQTPGAPAPALIAGMDTYQEKLPNIPGGPFKLDVDNMPLPAFINEVYGNMLHISYQIDKSLQTSTDLITLRISQAQTGQELAQVVAKILGEYGVAIKKEQQHYRFLQSTATPVDEPPLLISGRTLPEVPVSHRPIFQVVPLLHVRNLTVTSTLNQMYAGQDLKITDDLERNTITLQGSRKLVASALETLKFMDQPAMRGRYSLRIDPQFQSPDALSEALVQVLQSEGYGASSTLPMGSILVLPMNKINAVLVFSADAKVLDLVKEWVVELDQPTFASDKNALFYYPVKNTGAADLAKTLSGLVPSIAVEQAALAQKNPATAPPTNPAAASNQKTSLVVDEQRNAILFFGSAATWAQVQPILRQMDVQAKQVLIEVTIAEITLNDSDTFGVEWNLTGKVGEFPFSVGTLSGFNYILQSGGQTRITLKALAKDSRVNVLSTPRLMVKSGEAASIEVGDEIPILTSQGASSGSPQIGGNTQFTQNVQYRKTGVLLNIKPIVHSGRRIDIEVSQELSNALDLATGSKIDSPAISNRTVKTNLSLKDGSSILIAGLIKDNRTTTSDGILYLKDLPVIGNLFSTSKVTHDKSEIVIMINPYIMEDDDDVESISDAFRDQYSFVQPPSLKAPR